MSTTPESPNRTTGASRPLDDLALGADSISTRRCSASELARQLARHEPTSSPEIPLLLLDPLSPLATAIERHGLSAAAVDLGLPGPPYWAFAWAAGQALARHLLDGPGLVGRRVLDAGTGSGIAAIAAARAGAARVMAVDRDPLAVEAARRNAALNGVLVEVAHADVFALRPDPFDLVLAADCFYHGGEIFHLFETWAAGGVEVLLADPARGHLPAEGLVEVARFRFSTEPAIESVENAVRVYSVGAAAPARQPDFAGPSPPGS